MVNNLYKSHANLNVPYMLGSRSKYMSFYVEYLQYENMHERKVYRYKYNKDEKNFYVGYFPEGDNIVEDSIYIKTSPVRYNKYIYNIYNKVDRDEDEITISPEVVEGLSDFKLRIHFPVESISTYRTCSNLYYVNVYTYYRNRKVSLYANVLDTYENLAEKPLSYNSVHYQEYQDIDIVDIYNYIKKKPIKKDSSEDSLSFESFLLYVNIIPVRKIDDNYEPLPDTCSGSTVLVYKTGVERDIRTSLDYDNRTLHVKVSELYIDSILSQTDKCNPYFRLCIVNRETQEVIYNYIYKLDKLNLDISLPKDLVFDEGIQITEFLEFYQDVTSTDEDKKKIQEAQISDDEFFINTYMQDEYDEYLRVRVPLQPISVTRDIYDKLYSSKIDKVDAESLINTINEMSQDIRVVNEIVTHDVVVNQTNTSSGVVVPLFFRAYPLEQITLHQDVDEYISLNLDEYKGKVSKFYIKIGDKYFSEYTRGVDGVIFAVSNSESTGGTYYVCDGDKKFITSGKYVVE